jgi:pyrroloquinoline quinone biosynthesis protein D
VGDAGRVDGHLANGLTMDSRAPNKRPRLAKRARLHTDPVTGKPVLMHQEAVLVLNHSGYEILRLCDGTHTLPEIIQDLENRYPAAQSSLSQEISEYLEAISQKGLIEWI